MAYPSFAKNGVATVTLHRADAFPRVIKANEGQLVSESEGGVVRIATLHAPIEYLTLNFAGKTALLETDYTALKAFFLNALVGLRANTFTYTDSDSSVYTVRYWDGLYSFQRITAGLRQGALSLRIE